MIVPRFIRVRADKAGRRFFRFIHDFLFLSIRFASNTAARSRGTGENTAFIYPGMRNQATTYSGVHSRRVFPKTPEFVSTTTHSLRWCRGSQPTCQVLKTANGPSDWAHRRGLVISGRQCRAL